MTADPGEVVDAELVEDDRLPALRPETAPARPIIGQHTILAPGQHLPTQADQPAYSRLDFEVSADTAERAKRAGAANTRRNRDYRIAAFEAWCAEHGRVAYPCTTATFTEYGNHLIRQGLKPNTIGTYMSLIRGWQPVDAKPDGSRLRENLATYKREAPRRNRKKQSPPIRLPHLMAMLATCDENHPLGVRDAALLSCGYGALTRRIELADLEIEDVTVTDTHVIVYFPISKTDQDAEGATVRIPDRPDLRPVERMRAWLALLHSYGIRRGALFRALTRAGTLQSRVTASERGDFLTGEAINQVVKRRAIRAGIPEAEKVTAHGLRAGPTTDLAKAGVRGKRLNRAGRWVDESRIPETVYVRLAEDEEGDALAEIPVYRPEEEQR